MFGSKLVEMLWDTAANKGLGGLFKPWQIRREGIANVDVRRKELLILAQTQKDIEKIHNGEATLSLNDINKPRLIPTSDTIFKGDLSGDVEPKINMSYLLERSQDALVLDNIRKDVNVTKSLLVSESILMNDSSSAPESVIDDDWVYRWRDYAGNTNSENLQQLWGGILAGEIKSPGAYSLRTLEFLKNLTQNEAVEIESLCPFVFLGTRVLKCDSNGYISESINKQLSYDFLSRMQELGLLSGVDSMGLVVQVPSFQDNNSGYLSYITYMDHVLEIRNNDKKEVLKIPVYLLTQLGRQICNLCKVSKFNEDYLMNIANVIKKNGYDVRRGVFSVVDGKTLFSELKNV